jgi:magnesium chelatase family protein
MELGICGILEGFVQVSTIGKNATQPCPCGYYTDPTKECTCLPPQIQKYMARISGPLLDRIDIHIEGPAVKYKEISSDTKGESSSEIRERVIRARKIQYERFAHLKNVFDNGDMDSKEVRRYSLPYSACSDLIKMAMSRLGFSARAYDRILKVSRTIADLEASENILPAHISEAIQYRNLDRELRKH